RQQDARRAPAGAHVPRPPQEDAALRHVESDPRLRLGSGGGRDWALVPLERRVAAAGEAGAADVPEAETERERRRRYAAASVVPATAGRGRKRATGGRARRARGGAEWAHGAITTGGAWLGGGGGGGGARSGEVGGPWGG